MSAPLGGTITTDGNYTVHKFLLADTGTAFTTYNSGNVAVLVVAGGGGGGGDGFGGSGSGQGGGGAGGYVYNASLAVTVQAYTVTVGDGGAGGLGTGTYNFGTDGNNSVFSTITATAGGGGGCGPYAGRQGGSGGGAGYSGAGGDADYISPRQGYDGGSANSGGVPYAAAGGGGSAGIGGTPANDSTGGVGGTGTANSISGSSVTYATGGKGANGWNIGTGAAGTSNEGDGGAGGGGGAGGKGGSGIVIIRYLTSDFPGIRFDAAANSGDQAAASSYSGSASWAGTNRALTIDVSMLGAGVTVSSMTYGGANCTFVGSKSTVTSLGGVECWRILSSDAGAPAAGANTLVVTLSASIEFTVEWVSYIGVHQTSPTEGFNSAQATNTGSATDASVAITTVADNDWVHAAVVANDTSITAGNTTRNNISGTLGSGANEDNGAPKTPAGSVTMSYTGMGITTTWAIAGYALRDINASTLASTAKGSTLSLLGVG